MNSNFFFIKKTWILAFEANSYEGKIHPIPYRYFNRQFLQLKVIHLIHTLGHLFLALIGYTSSAETISTCSCEVSDINCNCQSGSENHRFKRQDAEISKAQLTVGQKI